MEAWRAQFAETVFARASDTAHDLKTPLNIAVLSLELLKMRVRKLAEAEDEKIREYSATVEDELRRLASIFDAFFVNAVPPRGEEDPTELDAAPLFAEANRRAGLPLEFAAPVGVIAHRSRIAALAALFSEGASRLFRSDGLSAEHTLRGGYHVISIAGEPANPEVELGKLFKFYYTDASGSPDLSLATARLIAETYGGELRATREGQSLRLELLLPQGGP